MKKGFKHSEETKLKMSLVNKGKKASEESKLKMSLANSGKNNCMYGKTHTKETKLKMSLANSGKNHPQWKGGISCEPYCYAWLFKEFKDMIKERDNHKCSNPHCNHKTNRLSIHHINYIKKDCDPKNLITLCTSCNTKANSNREWHQSFYEAMNHRRNI